MNLKDHLKAAIEELITLYFLKNGMLCLKAKKGHVVQAKEVS